MKDIGRIETDEKLKELEQKLAKIYGQANKELMAKASKFLRVFEKKDQEMRERLENGEITAEEYKEWREHQIFTSNRWKSACGVMAQDMNNVNNIARSISQGYLPEVYAINHNWTAYNIENLTSLNTNFALYDADTVERLLKEDPDIMPLASDGINAVKDIAWNRKVINSVLLQGILQGESIKDMSKRFEQVGVSNYKSAVRYSRTAITGAENAGRINGYRRAQSLGIGVKKVWLSTLDKRTRDSHRHLDGETRDIEEEFSNGCMHPGDADCSDPSEVWNCRCTLITKINGDNYDTSMVERDSKLGDMSYEDWKNGRDHVKPEAAIQSHKNQKVKKQNKIKPNVKAKVKPEVTDLINQIRNDVSNHTPNHETVINLGKLLSEDTTTPYGKVVKKLDKKIKEYIKMGKRIDELTEKIDSKPSFMEAKKCEIERRVLQYKSLHLHGNISAEKTKAILKTIAQIRGEELGGELEFATSYKTKAKGFLSKAANLYPKSWIDAFNALDSKPLTVATAKRGCYDPNLKKIEIPTKPDITGLKNAVHELGHGFEDAINGLFEQEKAFYKYRTKGEVLQKLGKPYRDDEKSRFDKFEHKYMGKEYDDGFELVSMGFDKLLTSTNAFTEDVEMERWLIGLLCAL